MLPISEGWLFDAAVDFRGLKQIIFLCLTHTALLLNQLFLPFS